MLAIALSPVEKELVERARSGRIGRDGQVVPGVGLEPILDGDDLVVRGGGRIRDGVSQRDHPRR